MSRSPLTAIWRDAAVERTMEPLRIEAVVDADGRLTVAGLPPGQRVEIRLVPSEPPPAAVVLAGSLLFYERPFDSVDEDEWDAAK